MKSLLSFSRGDRVRKTRVRIADVLRESLILTQAQIRKEGISLAVHLPEDLPEIEGNFHELQQVFLNIINNARHAIQEKFPGRNGEKVIEIQGSAFDADGRPWLAVVFTDRGTGIAADKISLLVMPFFSTKPLGKGTGLGLAIAHRIIADHGGRIDFESEEGVFTRVTVRLPAKED